MSATDNKKLLKFLSGPHQGAEVLLAPGDYTLGSDDGCDIVLNDLAFATEHLRLHVGIGDGQMTLTTLGPPAHLAGKALTTRKTKEIAPFQVISVGATHFSVGPAVGAWPSLSIPMLEKVDLGCGDERADSSGSVHAGEKKPAFARRRLAFWNSRWFGWRTCTALAVTGLLTTELIIISRPSATAPHLAAATGPVPASRPVNNPPPLVQVRQALIDLKLKHVRVTELPEGNIKLSGRLATEEQRQALEKRLAPFAERVTQHVLVSERLAASTKAIFKSLGLNHLDVNVGKNNVLAITGYVERPEVWDSALTTLRRDLPADTNIDDSEVDSIKQRAEDLRRLLAGLDLSEQLTVTPVDGELLVKGVLVEAERQRWQKAAARFHKRFDGMPPLTVQLNQPPREQVLLTIKSVTTGPAAFVVTEDGGKYLRGAKINGYTIKDILPDRLILSRNNVETVYYFGDS